ncbi:MULTISPECIES: tagatose-6-phosphate kinase [Bacillus cereus group]|uniref:tagatose-6-phosphate kinase n=1 Tax=Bacillus cereus group TaxID=86661 RepID=UPI00027C14C6|nr:MULTISPECIES: tagatose-6-phosphate kinase [Bacillus cereus group]EJV61616.1 tagatose-6-phosphate kinase [Bacillus cereus BAG6O-2]MBJ8008216.1 tagatose-6-phosphate kinase [Bacillus cereus]OFD50489.1 Tagatose-6-phosphate kinase [Bacillus mycoides]OFD62918.1 Tagatose-6-phosphate kinase [Bacillus mycoides]OHX32001.1 Tagatose-6-phosphate kinase [Bacillus mycoides]
MILSVTMNPSVDISYPIHELKLDVVNRVETVRKTAGGKGLNVARVIAQMEEVVLATGVLGGTIGEYIIQELNKSNIPNDFLKIKKESRNCIAILHEGMQTEILESGPTLSKEEGTTFLEKFECLLTTASLVTISGSLPKGLPTNFYYQMLEICNKNGIPVIMDSSGESLKNALVNKEKPFAIKPNTAELSQLLGINMEAGIIDLKQALNHELFTGIEWIIVSMGGEGAFVRHGEDYYRVTIPKIAVVNPVGSGDATVAGLAAALHQNQTVETVLKTAMATGMLNTMEAGTGYINMNKFKQCFDLVKVEKID